jgi:hypothetical protein
MAAQQLDVDHRLLGRPPKKAGQGWSSGKGKGKARICGTKGKGQGAPVGPGCCWQVSHGTCHLCSPGPYEDDSHEDLSGVSVPEVLPDATPAATRAYVHPYNLLLSQVTEVGIDNLGTEARAIMARPDIDARRTPPAEPVGTVRLPTRVMSGRMAASSIGESQGDECLWCLHEIDFYQSRTNCRWCQRGPYHIIHERLHQKTCPEREPQPDEDTLTSSAGASEADVNDDGDWVALV